MCWGFQDDPTFFRVLHAAKYGGKPGLLRVLGAALARIASHRDWVRAGDLLVPLPDDPQRRGRRGYSVTGILARVLAQETGAKICGDLLVRRRLQRTPQATLESRRERWANVHGLFGVGRLSEVSPWRPLVLVEDQVTTGATMAEALRLLGARGHPVLGLALGGARDAPGRLDRP
jgi:predicted amidophosphoribosyltransferase